MAGGRGAVGGTIQGGMIEWRRRCGGAGLVELMVGITLGLLVLAAMATLFANNSAARNEIERTSQQIENGRFALQLLRDDIHLAGYFHGFAVDDRRAALNARDVRVLGFIISDKQAGPFELGVDWIKAVK